MAKTWKSNQKGSVQLEMHKLAKRVRIGDYFTHITKRHTVEKYRRVDSRKTKGLEWKRIS